MPKGGKSRKRRSEEISIDQPQQPHQQQQDEEDVRTTHDKEKKALTAELELLKLDSQSVHSTQRRAERGGERLQLCNALTLLCRLFSVAQSTLAVRRLPSRRKRTLQFSDRPARDRSR
jgi:hypothetical protein